MDSLNSHRGMIEGRLTSNHQKNTFKSCRTGVGGVFPCRELKSLKLFLTSCVPLLKTGRTWRTKREGVHLKVKQN